MKSILFINYIGEGERTSGSSVRPTEMLNAFEQVADQVYLLSGNQIRTERVKKDQKDKANYREEQN